MPGDLDFALNSGRQLDPALANIPLTDQESRIVNPADPWTDLLALKICVSDFQSAERFRNMNHDWRFRVADELYLAWVAQKYWEGTKVPRASIPVFLVFQQVEAMLARLMSAIFSDEPWFQADPGQGTPAAIARQFRDLVLGQLDDAQIREILTVAIKSSLIYGAGIVKLDWDLRKEKYKRDVPAWDATTGQPRRIIRKVDATRNINAPVLSNISTKDFYVDPNAASPSLQHPSCQYVVERSWKDLNWLNRLRGNKEFTIPSANDLQMMIHEKPVAQADTTKSVVELMRFGYWAPQIDQSTDPAQRRLELLVRTSKERQVWILNRKAVIYNRPNPYGFINYYNTFYADVPDRFYGLSLCDVLEGEQRFRTSLINARVDELALSIHAPVQYKRGLNIPAYQLRTRPGQMIQVETPGEDYIRTEMGGVTQNAYIEDQASDARSQKTTGLSDLIASGVPSAGGNAAARTATGVGAQVGAGNSRIQGLLERLEDIFIEPLLNGVIKMNLMFPPIGTSPQQIEQLGQVKLYCRASAKMKSQQALLQTMPLFMQTVFNPAFLEQLKQQGIMINFNEFLQMILDATSFKNRADLITQLSPQQLQQMQQLAAQQQQQQLQSKMAVQQNRSQTQIQQANIRARAAMSLEQARGQSKMDLERMKLHGGLAQTLIPHVMEQLEEPESNSNG